MKILIKHSLRASLLSLTLYFSHFNNLKAAPGDTLKLDLGLNDPGSTVKYRDEKFNYKYIDICNVVGGFVYNIQINKESRLLPSLDNDYFEISSITENDTCSELKKKSNALNNYQKSTDKKSRDEKELASLERELRSEMFKSKCKDNKLLESVKTALASTHKILKHDLNIKAGEQVTIIITRGTLEWKFEFIGNSPGKWEVSYGFGFTSQGLERNTYFSKQIKDTAVGFIITKNRVPGILDLSYIPAVFYSYYPMKNLNKTINHSITGGLGIDLTAPVVFLGYNAMFRQNVGASIGVVFQQQYRIKEQYSENDRLNISLSKDQLHDKIYRPNLFISIHYRFGKNPFKPQNTD